MGKVHFITGTMMSGKTTHLLQQHFNLENAFPGEVLLVNKNDRAGSSVCTNRMGGISYSVGLQDTTDIIELVQHEEEQSRHQIKHILVDEAQFLTPTQVEQLAHLADVHDTTIYMYGLITTFKGNMFPATKRIIELADSITHLHNGIRCWCGQPATHNALFHIGPQPGTEKIPESSTTDYQVMCRKHFLEHRNNTTKNVAKSSIKHGS